MAIDHLAHAIVVFYEKLSSWEQEIVRDSGLTPGQMHAIEILGHEQPLRMKELAEKLGVTTGTLTVGVDRLEQKGLIARRPHETDRRSYRVVLTAAGHEQFTRHHDFHLKLTEDLAAALTPEEQTLFERALTKVIQHF